MLDVLMPVKVEEIPLAITETERMASDGTIETIYLGAVPRLEMFTDVPFRLIVCVDGGTHEDVALLRRYLPSATCEWALMQNVGVQGFGFTMAELTKHLHYEFVAIVPARIWIDDPKWFGKMQVVFTKDPHCFMVAADVPNTLSSTVPPIKLDHKRHPKSDFLLTRRAAMKNVGSFEGSEDFSRQAHQLGGTRWVASGVRYEEANAREDVGALEPTQGSDS